MTAGFFRLKTRLEGDGRDLAATLSQGLRFFPGLSEAAASATRGEVAGHLRLVPGLVAGILLSGSDLTERRHDINQDSLHGEGSLSGTLGEFTASLSGGWTVFAPRDGPLRAFLASGPEAWLRGAWQPTAAHELSLGYGVWLASYSRWAELEGGDRDDRTQTASVEYTYRGRALASIGYAFSWNHSTATGGSYQRHRLTVRGAVQLPADFALALRGTLQWSHYPQPIFLEQQLLLAIGQETQNAVEARLTHPLGASLEIALSAAYYRGEAVGGAPDLEYSRTQFLVLLGWHHGWNWP
jgi:hypothetical protein